MDKLERLSRKEINASQKGMDRRIAGWKLGDLRIYLLYTQIWRYYWFRIETPEGKLIETNPPHEHYFSYESALDKIADVIEELTFSASSPAGNTQAIKEFREPLIIKRKEEARNKALFEMHHNTEVFQQFKERFYNTIVKQGILMGDSGAVGLILDPNAEVLEREDFEHPNDTFTVKVNPRSRAKFKPYGRDILISGEFYRANKMYQSLMILNTKKPITFTQSKKGILMMEDVDNNKILVAPLGKSELDAERIITALPISKFLKLERTWKKSDVIKLLEEILELSRKELVKLGKEFYEQAKEKDYYHNDEDRQRYVNGALGHRGATSNYLSIKEALAKLNGQKVDHKELFTPYYDNKDMWRNGKLLI